MEREYVKFMPAEQRVLVLPDEGQETTTPGGIIIPESVQENKPHFGRVITVGTGCADTPMKYRSGQRVLYSQYAGSELILNLEEKGETFDNKTFKVMNQTDIWGTIEKIVKTE